MLDPTSFRVIFPEFSNITVAPDALIQFNLDLAYDSLNPDAWGDRLDAGAGFYAAHYLSLALARAASLARGTAPGMVGMPSGLVTAKSVGGVSKSMDMSTGQMSGGGSLNLTQYGQAYLTLLASVGVGIMQF